MPANQGMRTKMVEKVEIALYISDEQAAVMFPNTKGEIDMGAIFIGSDPMFYEWCNDLFDHYWQRGGYFDVRKTTVVQSVSHGKVGRNPQVERGEEANIPYPLCEKNLWILMLTSIRWFEMTDEMTAAIAQNFMCGTERDQFFL